MAEVEVLPFRDLAGQREELAKIKMLEGDPESAHIAEKDLWRFTLVAIGAGLIQGEDAQVAARTALETLNVDFPRWFA